MNSSSNKYSSLASFLQDSLSKKEVKDILDTSQFANVANILTAKIVEMFPDLIPFSKDINNFIMDIIPSDPKGRTLTRTYPNSIKVPNLSTQFTIDSGEVSPCCPSCEAKVFWSLPFCPYCHTQIPNLPFLHNIIEGEVKSLEKKIISAGTETTGEIIFQDDEVTITDRDLADAKRDIKKYIPV